MTILLSGFKLLEGGVLGLEWRFGDTVAMFGIGVVYLDGNSLNFKTQLTRVLVLFIMSKVCESKPDEP